MIKMAVPPPIHTLPDLEFDVLKEEWVRYKLSDGTVLYLKAVLVKLFLAGKQGTLPNLFIGRQTILTVRSNERKEPKPPEKPLHELPEDIKENVDVLDSEEQWNSYRVKIDDEHYILEMKPVVTMVKKIRGYYDSAGYPIYQVFHDLISRVRREEK